MTNCVNFRRAIQKAIKQGRFKLADKGVFEISTNTGYFPSMISFSKASGFKDIGKGNKVVKQVCQPKVSSVKSNQGLNK